MGQLFKMGEHRECHIPQPLGAHLRRRNPDSGPAVRGSSGRYRGSGHRIPASGRTRSDTFDNGVGDVEDDDHRAGADDDHQAVADEDHQAVADEDHQAFAEAVAVEDPQTEADSVEDAQVFAEAVAVEDPQTEADSVEDAQVLAEAEADSLEDEDGAPDRDRQADQDLLALTAGASDTPAPPRP
jgi:hypothetical protein